MKLSPEEIQFIDNYLKKSEVIYVDIRCEMVDHVATAVENKMDIGNLDFYEAFKQYMVANKKELLKNKGSWSIFSKSVIVAFLKFTVNPLRLVIAALLFLFFSSTDVADYFSDGFTIQNLFFILLLLTAVGQAAYFHFVLKQRFFVLERLGALLGLLYYLQVFFMNTHMKEKPEIYTLSIFYYLLLAYWWYLVVQVLEFQRYKKQLLEWKK